MIEYLLRLIGKGLVISGMAILLFSIPALGYSIILPFWIFGEYGPSIADILHFIVFFLIGIIVTYSGVNILRRFEEKTLFLTREGESIHSGEIWKKGSESGLFLTSCGRVVSINQESKDTAHVGYRIVAAEHATCRDCSMNEGKAVLDGVRHGRML